MSGPIQEQAKHVIDAGAIGGGVAAFAGWLPDIAAGLSIIWLAVRVYETILNIRLKRKELNEKD